MFVTRGKANATHEMLRTGLTMPYMEYADYDPTGRFLLTAAVNSFNLWSACGELLVKDNVTDRLQQIKWRTCPSLFSGVEQAKIAAEYEKYGAGYRKQDEAYLE
jgi:hypothetical protein